VKQGIATGLNGKLNAGETAIVWFDVQNNSALTAGGVELEVESLSPDVMMYGNMLNDGAISESRSLIRYFKINGTSLVSALSPANPTHGVPTANTYFKTNPHFSHKWNTGIWIKVSEQAQAQNFNFKVTLKPSNGAAQTLNFPAQIQ
jgi:hypothetical protein